MELNQPILELVRKDIMMMDLAAQGADIMRKNMVKEGKVTEWAT